MNNVQIKSGAEEWQVNKEQANVCDQIRGIAGKYQVLELGELQATLWVTPLGGICIILV